MSQEKQIQKVVDEGQSVEVCVGVSGGTIVEREVVVHIATSDLQYDPSK